MTPICLALWNSGRRVGKANQKGRAMNPILFQAGGVFAALALIGYTVISFMTGTTYANGAVVREGIKPVLDVLRAHSAQSRSDLADVTLLVGVVLALSGVLAPLALALMANWFLAGSHVAVSVSLSRPTGGARRSGVRQPTFRKRRAARRADPRVDGRWRPPAAPRRAIE